MPSPAIAQADIARAMAPHLQSGQVVFLPPGTFGSVVMARQVRELGSRAEVAWAETGTLPYLARKLGAARGAGDDPRGPPADRRLPGAAGRRRRWR